MPNTTTTSITNDVCVHRCASATELLATLRLSHPLWRMDQLKRGDWGFRGQADAAWSLVPRALRPRARLGSSAISFVSEGNSDCIDQLNAEYRALHEFVDLADEINLAIPGDLQLLWQHGPGVSPIGRTIGTDNWPPAGLLETLAIAQHSGIPTRLLDFTYEPLVAAYFAAQDAVSQSRNGHLAIWAINMAVLQRACPNRYSRICCVRVPRASNTFLRVQEGFFLFDRRRKNEPLEVAVCKAIARECLPGQDSHPVVRIEVPCAAANELLNLLALDGVDELHLKPSFSHVADVLNEQRASSVHDQFSRDPSARDTTLMTSAPG